MHARLPEKPKPDMSKLVISPMPGLVVSVDVEVGMEVEEGEAVCIVEAMKVFNELAAEIRGKIVAVLVDDQSPVDVGKPLFKVDTSA